MNNTLLISQDGYIAVGSDQQSYWFSQEQITALSLEVVTPPICLDLPMGAHQHFVQGVKTLSDNQAEKFRNVLLSRDKDEDVALLTRAKQLMHWYIDNQFCGRCGAPMAMNSPTHEPVRHCTQCDFTVYPRISPCVICLIYKDDQVLLARPAGRTSGFYSLIAGYIEAGESAEQAVDREIYEEVGLKVSNVQYALSQSWPFSHSLMLGFTAEYQSGTIEFMDGEIGEADWYSMEDLPQIPPAGTVATKLINHFFGQ